MKYEAGMISLPDALGLGVELDRDKLKQYQEYYKETGGYTYDRDMGRPDWYSITGDNNRWAKLR
jgi:glucarate dehydratase